MVKLLCRKNDHFMYSCRQSECNSPVFQQIKITSDKEWMNHIVPAETLHDSLDWAGLKVMGDRTGQIKCQ